MIIYDLNFIGMTVLPVEADAPLIVDADAQLTLTIAAELFKAVGRRYAKKFKSCRRMYLTKFTQSDRLNVSRQTRRKETFENLFCLLATECFNHGLILSRSVSIVKRYGVNCHGVNQFLNE